MRNDGKVRRKRKVPQAYSPADESAGSLTAFDCMTNNGPQTVSSKLDLFMTEELETKEAAYEVYRL